jgi:hypothetical protein
MRNFASFLILVCFACSDGDSDKKAGNGQMLVNIDGEESASTSITARVRAATTTSNPSAAIEASFESANGDFKILLSASTQDIFKLMDVGEYVVEGKDIPLNRGIIYYSPGGVIAESYVSFHAGGDVVGKIVLTQLDTANKLISGTFECTAAHKTSGEVVSISEGSFTRIPYTE